MRAASSSSSRVYRTPTFPSASGRSFAASYGVTNRLSEFHVRYPTRCGTARTARGERYGPWPVGVGQNFGSGVWAWTSSSASAVVSTDGGDPASGLFAVSFMQATAITPTRAAAIA